MVYGVPLPDGSFCFAQAIALAMVTVVDVALYSTRVHETPTSVPKLDRADLISFSATWKKALESGEWLSLGVVELLTKQDESPNQKILKKGTTVGIKHSDIGLLADICQAWHGLIPWNVMFKENYYDEQLAPGVVRSSTALVLSAEERESYRKSH